MRRIVLDTETTGLDPQQGHRVIEIACLELNGRRPTGRHFHRYLDPERAIDAAASEVHGLTAEDLAGKPKFADVADEFLEFVADAELLIHNAPFDVGFLDAELARLGRGGLAGVCTVTDTLSLARELHPGKKNSLNALCERYGIDNSKRTLHGALLDTQLLCEVWLGLTRGQETLDMVADVQTATGPGEAQRPEVLVVLQPSAEELAAHAAMCERIARAAGARGCLWTQAAGVATK